MVTNIVKKYAVGAAASACALAFVGVASGYYQQAQQQEDVLIPAGIWKTEAYGSDPAQVFDVYRPSAKQVNAPLVVLVHGGSAEEGGDKMRMRSRAEWYAQQGAVVVTPNYRYEEGEMVADVACALATAQMRAAKYGADGERLVVHGFSFGGWLTSFALFAGNTYNLKEECGAAQRARPLAWIGESTQVGNANKGENIYNDIVPDGRDGAINYLDEEDASVRVLLLHGTEDPKFNEERAQDFADAFRQVGGSVTVHLYENLGHSARLSDNARTQRDVLDFLESLE